MQEDDVIVTVVSIRNIEDRGTLTVLYECDVYVPSNNKKFCIKVPLPNWLTPDQVKSNINTEIKEHCRLNNRFVLSAGETWKVKVN